MKKQRVGRAIRCRVAALGLGLCLLLMILLTWAVAADVRRQLELQTPVFVSSIRSRYNGPKEEHLPGQMERDMLQKFGYPYYFIGIEPALPIVLPQFSADGYGSDGFLWGKWNLLYGFEAAVLLESDTVSLGTGNYLSFAYGGDVERPDGYGYVDLDLLTQKEPLLNYGSGLPTGDRVLGLVENELTLTGTWEGNQFHPAEIQTTDGRVLARGEQTGTPVETLQVRDLTLYTGEHHPVKVGNVTYGSLSELLQSSTEKNSLLDSVFVQASAAEDESGPFTCYAAVRCKPLQYAVLHLLPAYAGLLLVTILGIWLVLRQISRNLTENLVYLNWAMERGTTVQPSSHWQEVYALEDWFAKARQQLGEKETRLQELQTALDYAEDAEKNRRQLVSDLTHQLKTPLAVIHSYAEGLQAHIQEEKRDRYLAVILEEAEKMDGMVLQMLDLSRLEAGRIRLSVSSFSLLALIRTAVSQLQPLMEQKQLTVAEEDAEDFQVNADEARLEQVITNVLTNAIKYTKTGGTITIRCTAGGKHPEFSVENTAEPLPEETMEKLWEPFYRAESAGTEPGTGLGLAIVRQIVELHGGKSFVENTKSGVRFRFTL